MENIKAIIKYKDKYIVSRVINKLSFIEIPQYDGCGENDFGCFDLFVTFLCFGYLADDFSATRAFNYEELSILEDAFLPDLFFEFAKNHYYYDLDYLINNHICHDEIMEIFSKNLEKLPGNLELHTYEELLKESNSVFSDDCEGSFEYKFTIVFDPYLKKCLNLLNAYTNIDDKAVLLLYSGGRDSTLSAIKLVNSGYNVFFTHFDNGHMRDLDKPYLTYEKTFFGQDGFNFIYEYAYLDINPIFNTLYSEWEEFSKDIPVSVGMNSEMCCLCCRTAMYAGAIRVANSLGIKYIADGARNSQKFMLEQDAMTERFSSLAKSYGIEVLYPVIKIPDDNLVKKELVDLEYSSKTWESKCLLGKPAMDKTLEDEEFILNYFDTYIKPKFGSLIRTFWNSNKIADVRDWVKRSRDDEKQFIYTLTSDKKETD